MKSRKASPSHLLPRTRPKPNASSMHWSKTVKCRCPSSKPSGRLALECLSINSVSRGWLTASKQQCNRPNVLSDGGRSNRGPQLKSSSITRRKVYELSDAKSRNQSIGCDSRSGLEENALDGTRYQRHTGIANGLQRHNET